MAVVTDVSIECPFCGRYVEFQVCGISSGSADRLTKAEADMLNDETEYCLYCGKKVRVVIQPVWRARLVNAE